MRADTAGQTDAPLTAKQGKFLAALLSGATAKSAAALTGISEATAYRWKTLPAIEAALREARREAVNVALRTLQLGAPAAAKTLLAQLTAQNDQVRLAAARLIFDIAIKVTLAEELGERVTAIEAALERQAERQAERQGGHAGRRARAGQPARLPVFALPKVTTSTAPAVAQNTPEPGPDAPIWKRQGVAHGE